MKRIAAIALTLLTPLVLAAAPCAVIVPDGIDAVEEDWELVLATPDVTVCGPQVTTTMSPVGDTKAASMSFNLNYRDDPFGAGGLQVRSWRSSTVVGESAMSASPWNATGEQIAWTQRMAIEDGKVVYEIKNGLSTTWGTFGNAGELKASDTAPPENLDAYSTAESLANSGSGWQSNRVATMRLTAVRYYRQGELQHTDSTVRYVIGAAE